MKSAKPSQTGGTEEPVSSNNDEMETRVVPGSRYAPRGREKYCTCVTSQIATARGLSVAGRHAVGVGEAAMLVDGAAGPDGRATVEAGRPPVEEGRPPLMSSSI